MIDMADVDAIFDSIETEEHRSFVAIFCYWHNLLLLSVIGVSGYVWTQMDIIGPGKKRFD